MISNEDVNRSIEIFNKKTKELKTRYPNHKILSNLLKFSTSVIANWMEYVMDYKDENVEYNEKTINQILEWIFEINNIIKK